MSERFVDDYLLYLLARASHLVSRQFHARVKERGLHISEWRVLATLWDGDGCSVGELAETTLLEQPTLTKVINRMEAAALIERRADPADGRKVRIHIAEPGRLVCADLIAEAKRHERQVLGGYSRDDQRALKETLKTLIELDFRA